MDHAHHAPYRACLAPGPGHAGQSAVGARVPENSWGHRRSWRRRTVPQYRGFKPTPTSQITEAEVFDWWERYHLRHEGYETIAGDPTRQAAVRIAVSRLAHALDRPLRKGRPGRPRTRQIGRSDAEFLRKSRDAFVLFFSPLRSASIGTGSSRDGPPTRPRTTAHRRDAALVHESKLARHGPNHRCFIDRRRRKLGGPCRSHSAYCTRAALRPFSHRVSWLEDHRR